MFRTQVRNETRFRINTVVALAATALALFAARSNAQVPPVNGGLTTIASFDGTNGATPSGPLMLSGSSLYGVTRTGGANDLGTVYKIDQSSGALTTVVTFNGSNGYYPNGGLTASGSYLYGLTINGSSLFRLDPASNAYMIFSSLHGSFAGAAPTAVEPYLYGTTSGGGVNGLGSLYRIDTRDQQFALVTDFGAGKGNRPHAAPIPVGDYMYGTTEDGGPGGGNGTVYKYYPPSGVVTTFSVPGPIFLYSPVVEFAGDLFGTNTGSSLYRVNLTTGQSTVYPSPVEGLASGVIVADTFLYGVSNGGVNNNGSVYRFEPSTGLFSIVATFDGTNGKHPNTALFLSGGYLYGTTGEGGPGGKGTLFRLPVPVPVATTTTVDWPLSSAAYGAQVTLKACVQPAADSGTLTFRDGTTVLSTVPVASNGCASFTTTSLLPGSHSITAAYSGAPYFRNSTSAAVVQIIDPVPTTTGLSASTSPSHENYAVTFTANVYPPPLGGNVQFKDGGNVLGTVAVIGGLARLTTAALTEGSYSIVAVYDGTPQFQTSSSYPLPHLVLPRSKTKGDLNGDATADVVFQHSSSNAVAGWLLNGSTILATNTIATPAADWKVAAVGDLDGDGKSDLVLRNSATRATAVWRMNGLTILSGLALPSTATDWRVAAAFDFTSDDKADLILQNPAGAVAQWEMNGATLVAGRVLANPPADLKVITAASFGGSAGVVLQNSTTGSVSRWLVSGSTITSDVVVATPSADWKVKGAGDFTRDGVAELVVQNDATNAVAVWTLSASGVLDTEHVIATPVAGWKVVGAADYDGDGRHDILMQNVNDNRIAIWQTDGVTLLSGRVVATLSPGWTPILR
ncbi:MAG: hypothetical protein QOI24_3378 [Acidobacteriota bacterium]|jgi:uncharacterized repeat protein (TIGR03803 family)|nr:hypothetical protein [Acidobacteriota bacterium]